MTSMTFCVTQENGWCCVQAQLCKYATCVHMRCRSVHNVALPAFTLTRVIRRAELGLTAEYKCTRAIITTMHCHISDLASLWIWPTALTAQELPRPLPKNKWVSLYRSQVAAMQPLKWWLKSLINLPAKPDKDMNDLFELFVRGALICGWNTCFVLKIYDQWGSVL